MPKPEPDGPGPTDAPASAIPATLQDSLMARLDRLGSARRVAEIGAAIGQTFSLELLAAILPWPRADLEEALGRLLGAGLVRRASEGARSGFTFKHALVRDVAYSTLLRDRRRRLHARIAAALEHGFPDTPPELVAQHHARAGATRRAVRCWARAGEHVAAAVGAGGGDRAAVGGSRTAGGRCRRTPSATGRRSGSTLPSARR